MINSDHFFIIFKLNFYLIKKTSNINKFKYIDGQQNFSFGPNKIFL